MEVKKLLKTALLAGTFASALTIYSCGGGGGGSSEATAGGSITGNAIDGYLFASTVFVDCNNNGELDANEPSGFTFGDPTADDDTHIIDLDGDPTTVENYTIPQPAVTCANKTVYVTGGYDVDFQLAFGGVLIGKIGEYNNNVSVVTSIIEASDDPTSVKNKLETILGWSDFGVNYVEDETNNSFLKFVVATSTTLQAISQVLGQLDVSTAKAIYKEIGNKIAAIGTSEVPNFERLINAVIEGAVDGLSNVDDDHPEFDINNAASLKTKLREAVDDVLSEIGNDMTSYSDLGPYNDNDSIVRFIHNTVVSAPSNVDNDIVVGRIDITQIAAMADNEDNDYVSDDGSFDLDVGFTDTEDNDDLSIELTLTPENGEKIGEGVKTVDVTVGIKDVPQAVSRRSAIIRFKGIKLTIDNNGNVEGIDTNNVQLIVDGTDTNGNPAGLGRPLVLNGTEGLITLPEPNKINVNVDKLVTYISNKAPADHPLKEVQLDNSHFRIGVTIKGIPSRPIEGNLSLW